ncbi:cytochrome C [Burkholderia ubonensis]|uniref:c-type cytochrome n=1 Tax=Burkholderia ubonensis TaxID=101571 RepID=UPI000753BF64|nr:c-type cytochrome [Burkholderia ubonensis]KWE50854.1 cytochrome C [Burkholderia ubonensis]KWE74476.1 cytochrome C [Burkholderia ubonensis]KWE81566.1 cytochrome C [Burkholderia ubonensis]
MNDEHVFSSTNPWFRISVGAVLGIALVSAVVGFIWLPSVQHDPQFRGVWNAICSAAGVPRKWLDGGDSVAPAYRVSDVAVTPQLMSGATRLSIGRGATLAMQCTMCHGEKGLSQANSPNLAGQDAIVVYKQLRDFASGARQNAVMSPMVRALGDQDMRDLAAYYAALPRPALAGRADDAPAPDIVVHGAPMRNVPACATCHGGIDHKVGSPWLDGLPAAYTRAQLLDFANGVRHNDASEQMRNIARNMTRDEITAAASYYANPAGK